jgi:hypothetical protein
MVFSSTMKPFKKSVLSNGECWLCKEVINPTVSKTSHHVWPTSSHDVSYQQENSCGRHSHTSGTQSERHPNDFKRDAKEDSIVAEN